MSEILFYSTSIFFFLHIASTAVSHLALFEEKAFSVKRLFIHLIETKRGRNLVFGVLSYVKWLAFFSYFLTIFISGFDIYFHLLVFLIYAVSSVKVIKSYLDRELSFPQLTLSTSLILLFTIFLIILLFFFPPVDRYLWMIALDKMLPITLALFFALISIFFDFSQDAVLNRAIDKIQKYKELLTIAVVGSYGRGSTKEFIYRILSLKYNVLYSQGSYNNQIDIAKTINAKLSEKIKIFIAEIDDYKKDDVREMCALINPKLVVVSGVNEQKLSFFRNMNRVIESKLEAVNSLSRSGIALFNGNSEYINELSKKTKGKKFILSVGRKNYSDIFATNVVLGKFSVSFDVSILGKKYKLTNIRLLSSQSIENLLPAIFIGVYAGVDFASIRRELSKIRPLEGTMVPRRIKNGAVLIDDTYNANINSVKRALSYMRLYKGKKILVLEPLVELGKNVRQIHTLLGREIGKTCDYVFFTNDNYFKELLEGIKKSKGNCQYMVATPAKIISYIKENLTREDVVVFEGRASARVLSGITSERIY